MKSDKDKESPKLPPPDKVPEPNKPQPKEYGDKSPSTDIEDK